MLFTGRSVLVPSNSIQQQQHIVYVEEKNKKFNFKLTVTNPYDIGCDRWLCYS